jgi:hypothetical protein
MGKEFFHSLAGDSADHGELFGAEHWRATVAARIGKDVFDVSISSSIATV